MWFGVTFNKSIFSNQIILHLLVSLFPFPSFFFTSFLLHQDTKKIIDANIMFKSRKKRQQQKELDKQREQESAEFKSEIELTSNYKLLDDIHLTHDFRSSIILPELNKDLDPTKLSKQQLHLAQLRDMPNTISSPETPPLSPPGHDGTKQYQDLAAWRHLRSQNRYSNGLFGGKQRGRPKPNQIKKHFDNQQNIEEDEEEEEEDQVNVELAPEVTNQA